jgi:predicted NACHT family NTPase
MGDWPEVREEAEKLAKTICESDRVRQLAKNPLLLTTLLLVKRWVGQLPTRRSVLYGKALEVLLMTWNVEGHQPMELDEAIPQLAFIAFTMMKEGIQRISLRRLNEVLTLAREQMPEVLGYTRNSVAEFIKRIEYRSSLLMLSGYDVEDGTLVPMYEFRHLTFQEYLTARAIVEGYYTGRKDGDTLPKHPATLLVR